jgi:hypothetical protein
MDSSEYEVDVVWRKGEGEMPPEVKAIVDAAKADLLLNSLDISIDVANEIRYKAEKSSQSVSGYISNVLKQAVAV